MTNKKLQSGVGNMSILNLLLSWWNIKNGNGGFVLMENVKSWSETENMGTNLTEAEAIQIADAYVDDHNLRSKTLIYENDKRQILS